MTAWYIRDNAPTSTIGWSAVTAWSNHTAVAGELIRQSTTPTVGNERVFVCIVAGATGSTEPTWTVTKGARNTSSSATYQECTGQPAVNGDLANTPLSSSVRSQSPGLGKIITDNSGTHIFICSTNAATGAGEPSYSTGAVGNTTSDGSATWTYIGTSFSAWAAPFARLASALASTWGAAADSFFVGDDHAETQSTSVTITLPGTLASPNFIYSIDHTAGLPPTGTKSGASIASTGATNLTINGGSGQFDGLTFSASSGGNTGSLTLAGTNSTWQRFANCTLKKLGTVASSVALAHNASSLIELINTTIQFGAAGDSFARGLGSTLWRNTASAIAGATLPTTLMLPANISAGETVVEGVDLSALGSGKTLVGNPAGSYAGAFHLIDCKLGASVTIAATPIAPTHRVSVVRADSSGTNYAQHLYRYQGTLDHETTIIRTGGASDGTTGISWKIVTTANSKWVLPFECFPISIWNATITPSSPTITVYGIWGGGAVPNNDDIWFDVEYLGDSGSPLASLATVTKASNIASGSPLTSDSSTWGGSTTAFKMSVTLSSPKPQLAGYVRIYVRAAKASTTFYIDPSPVLS